MNDDHDLRDLLGEVIHAYTRADALADGVLIDVSAAAREAVNRETDAPSAG
jgi:Family of unknown function (DUF6573)